MQYSPKLKKAMEEIKQVIAKYDIAAFVMLHDEAQFSEYLNSISPSYSCATNENGMIGFRLKTAEVGKEKARKIAEGTYNMVTHFADILTKHSLFYIDAQNILKKNGEAGKMMMPETLHMYNKTIKYMNDQEKRLLQEALTEIRTLRNQNQLMTARLDVYDEMMRLFHIEPKYRPHGLMHPDIAYEIDKYLESRNMNP